MAEKIISLKNYASVDASTPYGDDYSFLDDMTQEEIHAYIEEVSAKCPRVYVSKINIEDKSYSGGPLEMTSSFPACNHTEEVGSENIGYSQGVLPDGTPYEAELWNNKEGGESLTVLIPVLNFSSSRYVAEVQNTREKSVADIFGSQNNLTNEESWTGNARINITNTVSTADADDDIELPPIPSSDCGVLAIGMVENGEEDDISVTCQYVEYLEVAGILHFTGAVRNGFVGYMTDINGTELAYIIVTLSVRGRTDAETDLHFQPFYQNYRE